MDGLREGSLKISISWSGKSGCIFCFSGTNDWWQGRPIGTFADYEHNTGNQTVYGSFRIIINKIRSLNEAARIILITPMQRGDFVYIGNVKNNAYGSYKEKTGNSSASLRKRSCRSAKREDTGGRPVQSKRYYPREYGEI